VLWCDINTSCSQPFNGLIDPLDPFGVEGVAGRHEDFDPAIDGSRLDVPAHRLERIRRQFGR
jgi:hypothetical protein